MFIIGYIFLFTALFAGAAKGFCGKKTSGYITSVKDSMLANIIRMLLCIIIGFIFILFSGEILQMVPSYKLILISGLSGISTTVFVVTWLISVKKSAYMMLDVFLMLGVLVPIVLGNIFFKEQIKPTQWIGIALLFIAVVIMCSYNNSIKERISVSSFLILLCCGVSNGITDFSQKLFVKQLPDISASVFNFYTYVFAAVTLTVCCIIFRSSGERTSKRDFIKISGYIFVMSIGLFANSFFKTLAAQHLSSVLLYPLNQGAALILSTAMSAVFFKEKLTAKCIIGIIIAFIGLITINML
ncbi:MAG: EamA family transporter [Oscillospiraceae bacterium]|nr:EamA family transporter [Oscillospiraceae bacterium]